MAAKNKTPKTNDSAIESGPSKAMLELLSTHRGEAKAQRLNMPSMIKPGDVPIGSSISGEIMAIVNSPVSTVKGKLIHFKHESGREFTFPATGVVRNALAPGVDGDKELVTALEKFVGKTLILKRLDDKQSAKYKKNMFMFDVLLVKD